MVFTIKYLENNLLEYDGAIGDTLFQLTINNGDKDSKIYKLKQHSDLSAKQRDVIHLFLKYVTENGGSYYKNLASQALKSFEN